MWELDKHTTPIAKKDYLCEAWQWLNNAGLSDVDFTKEELAIINKAKSEKCMILKGTKYDCITGKWEGEFTTFRARTDLNNICCNHELYEE